MTNIISFANVTKQAIRDSFVLCVIISIPILAGIAFFGSSIQATMTYFLILVVASLGFAVFTASSGILSFGHVAFMGIAAHLSALMTIPPEVKKSILPFLPEFIMQLHVPFLAATLITILIVSVIVLIVGIPISRLGGSEAAIATLGLLMISFSVIVGARDFTRGSQAMFGVPKEVTLWVALCSAVLCIFIARIFMSSKTGLMMRAVREDEPAALAIGIRPNRMRLYSWVLSGAISALAGILIAHYLTVFSPKEFYFDLTFSLLVMLILGGFYSITGAVSGTIVVTLLIEVLRRIEQSSTLQSVLGFQVFGMTQIGLCLVVLWVLYRHNEGMFGHRELSSFLNKKDLANIKEPLAAGSQEAFAKPTTSEPKSSETDEVLEIRNIYKNYEGVKAVENVSFQIKQGEIVGLIGPNGSGKTTLLGCIAGTHEPSSGAIFLANKDISNFKPNEIASEGIGRTFQTIRLFDRLSVKENVASAIIAIDKSLSHQACYQRAEELLRLFDLEEYASRDASTLAYGQQRRLEIARAMALKPKFLLLDEPAAGMNEVETHDLLEILEQIRRQYNIGILIVDHDLKLMMQLCDSIVVLNKGELIAQGTPDEVQKNEAVLEAYLGRRKSKTVNNNK